MDGCGMIHKIKRLFTVWCNTFRLGRLADEEKKAGTLYRCIAGGFAVLFR
jgi:hypothetical protein